MFSKLAIFAAATFAVVASAAPMNNSCNVGEMQCCNQRLDKNSAVAQGLLGLLGISLGDVTGLVGVNCSPLSVIGVGGNSCSAQPVCCENNNFNGLVALGCSPINLNL